MYGNRAPTAVYRATYPSRARIAWDRRNSRYTTARSYRLGSGTKPGTSRSLRLVPSKQEGPAGLQLAQPREDVAGHLPGRSTVHVQRQVSDGRVKGIPLSHRVANPRQTTGV